MKNLSRAAVMAVVSLSIVGGALAQEKSDFGKWYVSPGVGVIIFHSGDPVHSGAIGTLRLGYDITDNWSVEAGGVYGPRFSTHSGSKMKHTYDPTHLVGGSIDVLYHFGRYERWDPYLSAGAIYLHSPKPMFADSTHYWGAPRLGGGVIWNWTDNLALRANANVAFGVPDGHTRFYPTVDVGMLYRFGGGGAAAPRVVATGGTTVTGPGEIDTDGDGLSDAEEARLGTNPRLKDTDGDGLSDYDEVYVYKTDPLNPDSDYDGLSDGDEVLKYKTDPLKADTDGGGVSDGHEVLVDNTDPLNPNDDLMLFELNLEFGYDQTIIQAQYYAQLDVIAKVLERHPEATALIEGHADRRTKSDAKYNQALSEKRADAVLQYLVGKKIANSRLKAVGYGFTRPKVQPDLVNGNPENRRVEVYIRGAGGRQTKEAILQEAAIN